MMPTSAAAAGTPVNEPERSTVAEIAPGPAIDGMASGKAAMSWIMSRWVATSEIFSLRS